MSVFGSFETIKIPDSKTYLKGTRDRFALHAEEKKQKEAQIEALGDSIPVMTKDDMFDSHFAAYNFMSETLKGTLEEASQSDETMKQWENQLAQANAFAEKAKAYFTSQYTVFETNRNHAAGANPAAWAEKGVRDSHDLQYYETQFAEMNNPNKYSVSIDENGNFVIDGALGGEDLGGAFTERPFDVEFVPEAIRPPESWWGGHSVAGDFDDNEAAQNIEGRILIDPREKANAVRWYAGSEDLDSALFDDDDRLQAVRAYAEEAAKYRTSSASPSGSGDDEGPLAVNPPDLENYPAHDLNGVQMGETNAYVVPPSRLNRSGKANLSNVMVFDGQGAQVSLALTGIARVVYQGEPQSRYGFTDHVGNTYMIDPRSNNAFGAAFDAVYGEGSWANVSSEIFINASPAYP